MKSVPSVIVVSLLIVCGSCSAQPQHSRDFSDFISRFDSLRLPLSIRRNNLYRFSNRDFDTVNRKDPKKPYYQPIEPKYYKYLQNETMDKLWKYYFLFISKHTGFYVVMYEKTNESEESYWTIMNTLNAEGKIIDTMTLAGSRANVGEKYAWIGEDWKVSTTSYQFLPDEPSIDALVANHELVEYLLTNDGHFKPTTSSKTKGYFDIVGDTLVPYKKK